MNKSKLILFAIISLTSQLLAQDREPTNSTRERELGILVDRMNNNNNDYREPNRNPPQHSNTK